MPSLDKFQQQTLDNTRKINSIVDALKREGRPSINLQSLNQGERITIDGTFSAYVPNPNEAQFNLEYENIRYYISGRTTAYSFANETIDEPLLLDAQQLLDTPMEFVSYINRLERTSESNTAGTIYPVGFDLNGFWKLTSRLKSLSTRFYDENLVSGNQIFSPDGINRYRIIGLCLGSTYWKRHPTSQYEAINAKGRTFLSVKIEKLTQTGSTNTSIDITEATLFHLYISLPFHRHPNIFANLVGVYGISDYLHIEPSFVSSINKLNDTEMVLTFEHADRESGILTYSRRLRNFTRTRFGEISPWRMTGEGTRKNGGDAEKLAGRLNIIAAQEPINSFFIEHSPQTPFIQAPSRETTLDLEATLDDTGMNANPRWSVFVDNRSRVTGFNNVSEVIGSVSQTGGLTPIDVSLIETNTQIVERPITLQQKAEETGVAVYELAGLGWRTIYGGEWHRRIPAEEATGSPSLFYILGVETEGDKIIIDIQGANNLPYGCYVAVSRESYTGQASRNIEDYYITNTYAANYSSQFDAFDSSVRNDQDTSIARYTWDFNWIKNGVNQNNSPFRWRAGEKVRVITSPSPIHSLENWNTDAVEVPNANIPNLLPDVSSHLFDNVPEEVEEWRPNGNTYSPKLLENRIQTSANPNQNSNLYFIVRYLVADSDLILIGQTPAAYKPRVCVATAANLQDLEDQTGTYRVLSLPETEIRTTDTGVVNQFFTLNNLDVDEVFTILLKPNGDDIWSNAPTGSFLTIAYRLASALVLAPTTQSTGFRFARTNLRTSQWRSNGFGTTGNSQYVYDTHTLQEGINITQDIEDNGLRVHAEVSYFRPTSIGNIPQGESAESITRQFLPFIKMIKGTSSLVPSEAGYTTPTQLQGVIKEIEYTGDNGQARTQLASREPLAVPEIYSLCFLQTFQWNFLCDRYQIESFDIGYFLEIETSTIIPEDTHLPVDFGTKGTLDAAIGFTNNARTDPELSYIQGFLENPIDSFPGLHSFFNNDYSDREFAETNGGQRTYQRFLEDLARDEARPTLRPEEYNRFIDLSYQILLPEELYEATGSITSTISINNTLFSFNSTPRPQDLGQTASTTRQARHAREQNIIRIFDKLYIYPSVVLGDEETTLEISFDSVRTPDGTEYTIDKTPAIMRVRGINHTS